MVCGPAGLKSQIRGMRRRYTHTCILLSKQEEITV